jgi:kynureninase
LALVLLPGIQYYTGQVLPMAEVAAAGVESITPRALDQRGCQHSLRINDPSVSGHQVYEALAAADVQCGWRYPNVVRVAPVPLYNSFTDIHRFVSILEGILDHKA